MPVTFAVVCACMRFFLYNRFDARRLWCLFLYLFMIFRLFFSLLEYYRFFFLLVFFCLKQMNKNNHRQWTGDEYNDDLILFETQLYGWCDLIFHNFYFSLKKPTNESRIINWVISFSSKLDQYPQFFFCFRGAWNFFFLFSTTQTHYGHKDYVKKKKNRMKQCFPVATAQLNLKINNKIVINFCWRKSNNNKLWHWVIIVPTENDAFISCTISTSNTTKTKTNCQYCTNKNMNEVITFNGQ